VKPQTKWLKDLLADAGIPREGMTVRTDLGMTVASVWPEHGDLLVKAAGGLVVTEPRIGVVIWTYPCGCVSRTWVTTDPRSAGRVEAKHSRVFDLHEQVCPASTPTREEA
jgi:hypothetical protein